MLNRRPLASIAGMALIGAIALGAGTSLGVGPLASSPAPATVTDPREMVARSLQATIDANAVHLAGIVSGVLPGALLDRPESVVSLDGTLFDVDIRPKDGKTKAHVSVPGLGVMVDTVTVWDGVWYRTAPGTSWARASLGDASAHAGVDINPLTLVDRLRSYLATPGLAPTVRDVTCGSASGRCHEVRIDAGSDPAVILALLRPADRAQQLPRIDTVITLQTDVQTLRPASLAIDAASADGSVIIHLTLNTSLWDENLVIEEPSAGPG